MVENIKLPDYWNERERNDQYLEAVSDDKKELVEIKMLSFSSYEEKLPRVSYYKKKNPYEKRSRNPDEQFVVPPEDSVKEELIDLAD